MADPPSYEESTSTYNNYSNDSKSDAKTPLRFSIREEVGASRSQHVAALVAKLLPHIRDRARRGLSKSSLLLLPSNQDASRKGQLVGFPDDETPTLIQLEGRQDTMEFWTQEAARGELQNQMLAAISEDLPSTAIGTPLPERPAPPPATKSSFFGRKQSKAPAVATSTVPAKAPVTVEVQLEEGHFRGETEYGLFETQRCRGLLVTVEVR